MEGGEEGKKKKEGYLSLLVTVVIAQKNIYRHKKNK